MEQCSGVSSDAVVGLRPQVVMEALDERNDPSFPETKKERGLACICR